MTNCILTEHVNGCHICGSGSGLCPCCDSVLRQFAEATDAGRATLAAQVLMTYELAAAAKLLEGAGILDIGLAEEHVARIRKAAERYWNAADKSYVTHRLRASGHTEDEISIAYELYCREKTIDDGRRAELASFGDPAYGTLPAGFWR